MSKTACISNALTSEVQGECRAELARAMLSRSLHSHQYLLQVQRYNIFIAVYEYFARNFLCCEVRIYTHIWNTKEPSKFDEKESVIPSFLFYYISNQ